MKMIARRSALTTTAALLFAPQALSAVEPADFVFANGRVYTVNPAQPWAGAVAIRGGRIVHVGDDASAFVGPRTRRIDLKGRMLLPGFTDTHNHTYLRAENLFWVTLPGTRTETPTLQQYRAAIDAYKAANRGLRQLRGVGWNMRFIVQAASERGLTPRELLDDLVGLDIPAVIITHGHHEIWANTRAIRNAGVTEATPNPPGAFIERDAAGAPNGVFREFGAQNLIISKLPEPDFTVEEFKASVLDWQANLAPQRGVTAVLTPTHYPSENYLKALQALSLEGRLTTRFDVCLWADETRGLSQVPDLIRTRARYGGPNFKVDSVKIFGTGQTAQGLGLVWDQDVLNKTVAALDKAKFRIFIHDIGPTSTYEAMLDAHAYAIAQNGRRDARHIITHVGDAASPTTARFLELGVRADGHPPPKAFFDTKVPTTISSDYPVGDFSPVAEMARGVQRGVPLEDLIAAHTLRGAEAVFAETAIGSIEVGKMADLVVLERDLFAVPADELAGVKPVMTLFAGKEVFRSAAF
ncbi:amidohydrolase [Phenylobacterium sp.]|jgi:predicted amidohydrolase YtcJ|uniref:amidohydrolase n=1 Tax=Phenylobacterium sp. TaxID=1871053 RepID=UPI003782D7EC